MNYINSVRSQKKCSETLRDISFDLSNIRLYFNIRILRKMKNQIFKGKVFKIRFFFINTVGFVNLKS